MIPVIAISLVRSKDRRDALAAHLTSIGIPFEYFDAIDGNSLTVEQARAACRRSNPRRYGEYLLPTEVGCIASFRIVCERIARGEDEFVCVLEDDVTLDRRAGILLDEATLRALPRFDVLRIQHTSEKWLPLGSYGGYTVRAPYRPTHGMYAQIFTRRGAGKVASTFATPWMPGDMTAFADGLVKNLRILEIDPPLAFHAPEHIDQSTIDPGRMRPRDADRRTASPPLRRWRRTAYEYAVSIRVFRNFISLWGPFALRQLRQ